MGILVGFINQQRKGIPVKCSFDRDSYLLEKQLFNNFLVLEDVSNIDINLHTMG